jgi:hypothetical protein
VASAHHAPGRPVNRTAARGRPDERFQFRAGSSTLAWILTGFVAVSGLIGFVFAPRNEGKTLDQIQRERHGVAGLPRSAAMPRTS